MFRMHGTLAVALALIASPAIGHGPFDGAWSVDPGWCDNVSGTDEVPLMIDLPTFEYYESLCIVDTFERIGDGDAWRAEMTCEGEGDTWTRQGIFGLSQGPGDAPPQLVHVDTDEGTVLVYSRCP